MDTYRIAHIAEFRARDKARYHANPERSKRVAVAWKRGNPEQHHRHQKIAKLKKKYGLTIEQYERMLAEQDGRCAICFSDKPGGPKTNIYFAVDHCHETGRIRGLLCFPCNTGLGLFRDNAMVLLRASEYLVPKPLRIAA